MLISKLAAPLAATPFRISVTGHTAANFIAIRSDYDGFDLSADRANVVRQILEREGLPPSLYLRSIGQVGQHAFVSGRSVTGGESARDHYLDARASSVATEFETLICRKYYVTGRSCRPPGRFVADCQCYSMIDGPVLVRDSPDQNHHQSVSTIPWPSAIQLPEPKVKLRRRRAAFGR